MEIFPRDVREGFFWLHDLFWLLIVVAIVVGVFLVVRAVIARPDAPHGGAGSWPVDSVALHELDLRYARGELGREDFLQRRGDLLGPRPGAAPGPHSTPPPAAP